MVIANNVELERARNMHRLRSYRIVAVMRIGVLAFMVGAMVVSSPESEWGLQLALAGLYGFAALTALILAFVPFNKLGATQLDGVGRLEPFAFIVIDVVVLVGLQLLSTDAIYPLLIMILLPVLVGLDVSSRRAGVVLAFTLVGFVVAGIQDTVFRRVIEWPDTIFLSVFYAFLCATAFVGVRVEVRHVRTIAGLSALREELLAQTMTASEDLQRRISEAIHDGPLQDVLAVRQEVVELQSAAPDDERIARAMTGLQSASDRLRQATFELHPAVLEQVGLGAAVAQLAVATAQRSGIEVTTDIDYPVRTPVDPIAFGVIRELLSNVVRHSRATEASVSLLVSDHSCVFEVSDNGIGITDETMARRLGEGHIGLASHRTRVEAAGGVFAFMDTSEGTRIRVEVPLPH
ncbi:sensor histidine kinase [Mycobacterium sp. 1423905.2]|uniref:sensor histidine kinase n=1 Tax=Mycobacterium sp. 1423905.2 TaxID=1856859 RepID=UPI0007FBA435|nr:ATP-binding protein [Mycobacterium sp. 1423905.2]OBJ50111.1 histidine kinase [Mycobacterium sp. 1423905.2]